MLGNKWRQRALTAEAELSRLQQLATLVNIEGIGGRKIQFTFLRNNELTTIETYGTWGDNIEEWKKALIP